MRFLTPLGFLALLLAGPIILLYLLRLQRRNVTVPSVLLWSAVLADRHANRPWQKLRRNWMLILQLLVLLALALALARPALPTPMALHGQVIVLLDASASMQAADGAGGRQRFEEARQVVLDLSATLNGDDRVALVAVGPTPRLLLRDGDASALRQALAGLAPTDGPADWDAASALASGLATGDRVTSLLVTDAAVTESLPALPGRVRLFTVGDETPNAGVAAFSLRRSGGALQAFVRVHNAGPAAPRTISLYADGALFARQEVELPTGGDLSLTFDDVPVTAWAEVRLEPSDALAVDDSAWVTLSEGAGGDALLVTPGNRFLAQALRVVPNLRVVQTPSLAAMEESGTYGMAVVDGPITGTLPATNLWLIAPASGTLCGDPGAVVTPTTTVRGQWSHPLLQYVDWSEVHVARARRYDPPDDAEVLLESGVGPLLWSVERPGQRAVCMAFALQDSDLPLRVAFPLLTANVTGWLMPLTSAEPVLPLPAGRPWIPPLPPAATAATLVLPGGVRIPISTEAPVVGEAGLGTDAGLYRIEAETPQGRAVRYAGLSLLSPAESDLFPRPVQVSEEVVVPVDEEEIGWRDVSRWPILAGLVLVLVEGALWWGRSAAWRRSAVRDAGVLRDRLLARARQWAGVAARGDVLLRLALVTLLLLALSGFRWSRRTRDLAVVFLLDRSASTREAWDAQEAFVEEAVAAKADADRAAVVVFGGDAWVDRALSAASRLATVATVPRADATDIEEAVRLGLALLPDGAPGRMVLLSDGLETAGRAAWALREAEAQGVDLMVHPVGLGAEGPEVWISDLRLPSQVYPGDRVPASVEISSNARQQVRITWSAAGQSGQDLVALTAQAETQLISFSVTEPGFVPLRICLEPEADTFTQNNCADGWVMVEGPPRVLVVGEVGERATLAGALEEAGLNVVETEAARVPLVAPPLADYAAVVLVNTPARVFSSQSLAALRSYVRDFGGGLVAVGGPQSYGVGGWLGTPLEEALPVEMRVRDPERFPPLAMAILIDKSGSMAVEEGGVQKIRLAAEAAVRVAETLNDADILTVVAFDDRPADTFGPVSMAERDVLISQLLRLQAGGGGIYVNEGMRYTSQLLLDLELSSDMQKHFLLLADGSDAERKAGVLPMVEELVEGGMTVSAVSIGDGADVPFLRQVAEAGQGRFYLTQQAADLPVIFAEEAAQAKRSYVVEERFYPRPVSSWAPVAGVEAAPPLQGYVAATPKSTAQVVWEATREDPLLAVWQYGLGRAVAWTSDASGRWAAGWVSWDDFARFWGGVVRSTLAPSSDAGLVLRVLPEDERARIVVDATEPDGSYVDGLDLAIQVAQPFGNTEPQTVALEQVAPGRYAGYFVPPEEGTMLMRLHGDRNLLLGWAVPSSEEYVPADAEAAIERLVAQSGAAVAEEPGEVFVHNLRGHASGASLAPLLLAAAALLWPVDIAWRRLALSRSDVLRAVAWGRSRVARLLDRARRRKAAPEAPAGPPSLAAKLRSERLQERPAERAAEHEPVRPPERPPAREKLEPPEPRPRSRPSRVPEAPEAGGSLASRLKRRIREEKEE